jgi:hypothetical protein
MNPQQLEWSLGRLALDPRCPGFQGLTIHANGSITLVARVGSRHFATLAQFWAWVLAGDTSNHP